MKSLRARLILSHILPQILILPLLGLSLALIIESQILLTELAKNLTSVALAAAQNAASPVIWQDPGQAADFARRYSESLQREIILLGPDGRLQAASISDTGQLPGLTANDLATLQSGELLVRSRYSPWPGASDVEALAPVLDSRQVVIGIVRVTDRLGNLYANFRTIRNLEIAATLLALVAAVGLGVWLARRTELRLLAITAAMEQVAAISETASEPAQQPGHMPPEFGRVFAAIKALSERLRASEDARKRLLANLVHEVARPLGAIQAAVHALQRGAVQEPTLRQELLQGMDDQIERLKPLLDNLASLYTLSNQSIELQREMVDLNEWLPRTLVTWQAAARARSLEWQTSLPGNLPAISIDPSRMAQVLGNLVGNAIQYTPEGGRIQVSAGSEAGRVWIAVKDSGIGITAEERQKIFDAFYRGPRSRRFPQGMGLGLSIAAEITRLHGGDIQVDSEVDHGSCFTLSLPLT